MVKAVNLRSGRTKNCGCVSGLVLAFGGSSYPPREISRASLTYIDGASVEMLAAKTVQSNNTSGVPGVEWLARKRAKKELCERFLREFAWAAQQVTEG